MSAFGNAIDFLNKLGVYDVVLPFLLVFTLIYAFLEKSKIYGIESYVLNDGTKIEGSRRNLNAMTSFVIAFFVVASTQLVAVINQALSHMVLLLLLVFCFILVVGSFHGESDKGFVLDKTWRTILTVVAAIVILFIFLNALGWLEKIYRWILLAKDSSSIAALLLVLIMAGFIALITREPKVPKDESDSS